jgi:hypothetical protein
MIKNHGQSILKDQDVVVAQNKLTIPLVNISTIGPQQKGSIIFDPVTEIFYISNGSKWFSVTTSENYSSILENGNSSLRIQDSSIIFSVDGIQKLKIDKDGILSIGTDEPSPGNISHFQGNIKVDGDVNVSSIVFENGGRLFVDGGILVFEQGGISPVGPLFMKKDALKDDIEEFSTEEKILESSSSNEQSIFIHRKYHNTTFGKNCLEENGGEDNTAIGYYSLRFAIGQRNTAVGSSSLQNTIEGCENTGVGFKCLLYNIKGNYNTGVGSLSLSENVNGIHNTALGANCLSQNEGSYNTAIGSEALRYSKQSLLNIAIGKSMVNCTNPGIQNISIGQKSIDSELFTGHDNIAIGTNTCRSLIEGTQNIAIGPSALDESPYTNANIAIGANALGSLNTSSEQIAIGTDALLSNTDGKYNTALGTRCLFMNTNGSYNTSLGYESMTFNKKGSENVSIGSYSLFSNEEGNLNIGIGKESLQNNKGGSCNIAIGVRAGDQIKNCSKNIFIGNSSTSTKDVEGCIVLGDEGCATENDQLVIHGKSISGIVKLNNGIRRVKCKSVTERSRILLTSQYIYGVPGFLYISDRNPTYEFTIKSSSEYDNSDVAYFIFEP